MAGFVLADVQGKPGRIETMCLLVVDDEPVIRQLIVELMAEDDFIIREASSAREAICLLDALPRPVRALITDLNMPGQEDGVDLVTHVRRRSPNATIVVVTGRPNSPRLQKLEGNCTIMTKPFKLNSVRQHIVSNCPKLQG